jgi:hypothetical protein
MNEEDIIIKIYEHLKTRPLEFSIIFSDVDALLELPEGSAEKHFKDAANDARLEIVRQGEISALLRKKASMPFA